MNSASQMAFTVAAIALAAAGVGVIVNHWVTGWMAVGGMVGVGLFYAAIGVLSLTRKQIGFDAREESVSNASQRTARALNLYSEPVLRPQIAPTSLSKPEEQIPVDGERRGR